MIFDIFFSAYMKEEQDFPRFLATIIFGSLTVGLLSGGLLLFALSLFSNKLKHYNSELQISLTIVAAYANFYFAEAVVGASGILSLVLIGTYPLPLTLPLTPTPDPYPSPSPHRSRCSWAACAATASGR